MVFVLIYSISFYVKLRSSNARPKNKHGAFIKSVTSLSEKLERLKTVGFEHLIQRSSTRGTCTAPLGYICLSEGIHLRLAIDAKYIYISFISNYLYICQGILFSKAVISLLLNTSVINHAEMFFHKKF